MDNLTHTLVGIAISRAGFKRRVPYATTALIIAANAPDLDLLWSWPGINYIRFHRAFTHSLPVLPVWTVAIAIVLRWAAARRQRKRPLDSLPSWLACLLLGFVGVGSHVLLDFSNAYGVRLLAPFSDHWYAWSVVPIIDVWLWIMLLALLVVPMLFALISREITSNGPAQRYRTSAIVAIAVLLAWLGARSEARSRAAIVSPPAEFSGEELRSVGLFPLVRDPLHWSAVYDFPDRYLLATVNAGSMTIDESYPRQTLFKPAASDAVRAAESASASRIFLQFARYPLAEVNDANADSQVFFTDLRFARAQEPFAMGVDVVVNAQMQLVSQQFAWARQRGARELAP